MAELKRTVEKDDPARVRAPASSDAPLRLVVMTPTAVTTHTLPLRGEVTIGRAAEATIVLDDAAVSRLHMAFTLGPRVLVRDLGSSNGTRVRDVRIEAHVPVEVLPGDVVDVGDAMLVLQSTGRPEVAATPERAPGETKTPAEGERADVVLEDPEMLRLHRLLTRVAAGVINVLVLGETGVGKEIFAERLHRASPRASKPFVRLNCAALSESLLESELFGHEKGAFTGADRAKEGLIESADGGTVFLDEAGEMPMSVQVKLLRVIEEHKVTRVGALRPRSIDVRFVTATHRDLEESIRRGTFRQDLYFRLNGISLVIPPLRARRSEVLPLARLFLREACARSGIKAPPVLSAESVDAMLQHDWPGNLRELRNTMERAALLAGDDAIAPEHLFVVHTRVAPAPPTATVPTATTIPPPATPEGDTDLRGRIESMEKQAILDALKEFAGNQTRAAQKLGMSRRTLVSRLAQYGIARPRG